MKWLFFSCKLPPRPSKVRVYVWRQLKKIGAVNYRSVWVVPHVKKVMPGLEALAAYIESYGGGSLLIEGKPANKGEQDRILKAFLEASTEEYQEIVNKCEDFLKEIATEIAKENFIFAEVEENEEELDKLKKWLRKIEERHLVKNPLRKLATDKLKLCEKALDDFSVRIFHHAQKRKRRERNRV